MRASLLCLAFVALACVASLALAQSSSIINVASYGAVGDGKTDCSAAVAKAVGDWNSAPGGATLYFPSGIFYFAPAAKEDGYISASLYDSDWSISGSGSGATFLLFDTNAATLISAASTTSMSQHPGNLAIANLTISVLPVNVSQTYYPAISLTGPGGAEFSLTGVTFESQVGAVCVLAGPAPTGGYGASLSLENVFVANGGSGVIVADSFGEVTVQSCTFIGSSILQAEEQEPVGITLLGSVVSLSVSNTVFLNTTQGILTTASVEGAGSPITVADCLFTDPIDAGIRLNDNSTLTVTGSQFHTTVTPQVYNYAGGIAVMSPQYTSSSADSAFVTVSDCYFAGLTVAVGAHTGQLSVTTSQFQDNSDLGVMFVMSHDSSTEAEFTKRNPNSVFAPYNVTHSSFRTNGNGDLTGMCNMAYIQFNSCKGAEPSIQVDCDFICIVTNNTGCAVNPVANHAILLE